MWTYTVGPFLALLPRPWRDAASFTRFADPVRATTVSGLAECIGAIVALGYWYMYMMTTWVDHATQAALAGKLGPVNDQSISAFALSVWATHPLTWFLIYLIVEGVVRLCAAAFTGSVFGTLPLVLFDKIFINPFRPRLPQPNPGPNIRSTAFSFLSAFRERMMVARLPEVLDQLRFHRVDGQDFLEVLASRRKEEWNPPRVVRYEQTYYRLESCAVTSGPRPFRYKLRRLSAGVPGRSVLLYTPPEVQVVP